MSGPRSVAVLCRPLARLASVVGTDAVHPDAVVTNFVTTAKTWLSSVPNCEVAAICYTYDVSSRNRLPRGPAEMRKLSLHKGMP